MGCKFSKTNKVLPVVEPTYVKPATLPPTSQKTKKGLAKRRSGKKKPPVTREAPPAANDDASPAVDDHPSFGAESTLETNSFNLHSLAERQQNVDCAPIRLVKEADVCNREITPFTLRETPGTLVIKRYSQGSFTTDPLTCAGSSDSGIGLARENNEYAKVITEKSSSEKQEIAKVYNKLQHHYLM